MLRGQGGVLRNPLLPLRYRNQWQEVKQGGRGERAAEGWSVPMPRAWGAYSPALEYRGQQETITRNQGALRWVYGNSAENVSAKETPSEATKGMTGIGKANGEGGGGGVGRVCRKHSSIAPSAAVWVCRMGRAT